MCPTVPRTLRPSVVTHHPGGQRYDATTADDPAFDGAPIVSGFAYGDTGSGFANLYAGPFPRAQHAGFRVKMVDTA
jgi:hypothetical protein